MSEATETDWAEKIGASAFDCLREMVAALECDYERLEELRESRADLEAADAAALAELQADWDADNGEELKELTDAAGECKDQDDARQRIEEDPLSVEVRSDWCSPGAKMEPGEYRILLSTGGPATCIEGDLDDRGEPCSARLLVQDWFKPWTEYFPADRGVLLAYARCFCWGC